MAVPLCVRELNDLWSHNYDIVTPKTTPHTLAIAAHKSLSQGLTGGSLRDGLVAIRLRQVYSPGTVP